MMIATNTQRINAASMVATSINRDLDNRPDFTMTRDQLRARIAHTLDCDANDEDRTWIFNLLAGDHAIASRFRD
jgi:hypothetical protein